MDFSQSRVLLFIRKRIQCHRFAPASDQDPVLAAPYLYMGRRQNPVPGDPPNKQLEIRSTSIPCPVLRASGVIIPH